MPDSFSYSMASWIPFQDKFVLERMRNLTREELTQHENPNFRIKILDSVDGIMVADMVLRIQLSDLMDQKLVMICPNPAPSTYGVVAEIINRKRISCRNVHLFAMDEWANEQGEVAPPEWKPGLTHSFLNHFIAKIDPELCMPIGQVHYFTTKNINDYSKIIEEAGEGGADICYSGPGWSGHLAFIDPNSPEFACDSLDNFLEMGSRLVTLHPTTIHQQSLHGCFGYSGDLASVPTKGVTIGPLDVKRARARIEIHGLSVRGTDVSWQRMISRLVTHGPVTPQVPSSILQRMKTDVYLSESIARPFGCENLVGY
ncbi:MAG: hypothetical protein GXY22_09690 [Clostridiaceae bacterium]|nr:hypothetical protein [Clostridiaceae bacterium]